jgi:hypothetical protein
VGVAIEAVGKTAAILVAKKGHLVIPMTKILALSGIQPV